MCISPTKKRYNVNPFFLLNRVRLSMSLATSIKDFSDTVNNLHTVQTSSLPIWSFLQEMFVFSVKTIISGIVYIFTFSWFRDISYLPLFNPTSPQQLEMASAERFFFPDLTFSHLGNSFFTDSALQFFSFSSSPKGATNFMLSGVINSFFFSLPFSLSNLISIRRLFSQGVNAAFASLVGSIAAHSLFLISIFYGLRFLIIPWFSLEVTTYVLGFSLNVIIIKELIQASPQRFQQSSYAGAGINTNTSSNNNIIDSLKNTLFGTPGFSQPYKKGGQKNLLFSLPLLRISLCTFGLTWCEELNVFSCVTHLTLNAQNSYLDLYPSTNASHYLFVHTLYVLGFVVGNCVFSIFFYYLLFQSGAAIASWTNLSSTRVNQTINKVVLLLILTFTFASFPYYGLDYLVGKVGGFLPEDPVYKESVLSPTKITVHKKNSLFIKAESADKKKQSSLLDINNFDNGVYLNNIDFNKFDNFPSDSKGSISRTISFEKSNYRQENAWIRRNYLARLRARPRKNSENSSTASFYKAFKDPKAYYQRMQLESDRKQSQKMRDIQAKKPSGFSVGRKEGVLAEEPMDKMQYLWDRVLGFPRDDLLQILKNKNSVGKERSFKVEGNTQLDSTLDLPFTLDNVSVHKNSVGGATTFGAAFTDTPQKESSVDPETNIFAEKYTKGVKQKSSVPLLQKTKSLSTKNIIKRKFFLNPVYRSLLQTDIDAFLARQPVTHNIAENQDYDLYKKRVILERYYNWLRCYAPLQNDLQDLYNIPETKSFVDSVFHHQFKGTLKIAKRLFPITFDLQQNSTINRVLSYEQTLYKDLQASENPLLHEELVYPIEQTVRGKDVSQKQVRARGKSSDLKRVDGALTASEPGQPELGSNQRNTMPAELQKQAQSGRELRKPGDSSRNVTRLPFIEESDISPFYAGWDDTLRRFVITNKFFVDKG